jgi:hypothetical protein
MPYVSPEQIEHAKQMDLLTYLQSYEPQELIRFSGDVYTTRTHDSLKISNGKWCWWSRGIGGRSALDYLIKVRGMPLPEAVIQINGQAAITPPAPSQKSVAAEPKTLLLPERNENNNRVISYLTGRGIHRSIIAYIIHTERLYESRDYHNAVFVGFDRQNVPRYGALRGTSGSRFMGDVNGSDKHYSFSIPAISESAKLHLFESAIDLLSFGTLELLAGRDWRRDHCLSLAGVYMPKKVIQESTPPAALMQYLEDYPEISAVSLHLDNDAPGRMAAVAISVELKGSYIIENSPPPEGKDYNEMLQRLVIKAHFKKQKTLNR